MMNHKVTLGLKRLVRRSYFAALLVLPLLLSSCQPSPIEQYELDRPTDTVDVARRYFTFFLATQNERVYELAHPDLHEEIEDWINANEPTCDIREMPDYIASPLRVVMFCRCTLTVEGMWFDRDEAYSPYIIVTDFDSIRYTVTVSSDLSVR